MLPGRPSLAAAPFFEGREANTQSGTDSICLTENSLQKAEIVGCGEDDNKIAGEAKCGGKCFHLEMTDDE